VASPQIARDYAVQMGAFPAEGTAREIALASARLEPDGQPRVQPMVSRGRTLYRAQLLGLSESEARTVCANLYRRVLTCQVSRLGQRGDGNGCPANGPPWSTPVFGRLIHRVAKPGLKTAIARCPARSGRGAPIVRRRLLNYLRLRFDRG